MRSKYTNLTRLSVLAAASAAVLGGLAAPSQAAAGNIRVLSDYIQYTGTAGTNDIRVYRSGDQVGFVETNGAATIVAGPGCTQVNSNLVTCPVQDVIAVNLAAGDDSFGVLPNTPAYGVETYLFGDTGQDTYHGGLDQGTSRVLFNGGADRDKAAYGSSTQAVTVTIDDQAVDGRPGKLDRDDIRRDVEALSGSAFADNLVGSEFNNFIFGDGGRDTLMGGAGKDHLNAHDFVGDSVVDEKIDCGSGGDERVDVDKADPGTKNCERVYRN